MRRRRPETNRFSHAYIGELENAYARDAFRHASLNARLCRLWRMRDKFQNQCTCHIPYSAFP
jgi:hypothetical protein